jgi:hypothetical protein
MSVFSACYSPDVPSTHPVLRFIEPPLFDKTAVPPWTWRPLRVVNMGAKNDGVVADGPIPAGLIIPYMGELVETPTVTTAAFAQYVYDIDKGKHGVDAKQTNGVCAVKHKCIAGMINEASAKKEYYNVMAIYLSDHQLADCPDYGEGFQVYAKNAVFFVTVVDIKDGEELLVYYGDEYRREGYVPRKPNKNKSYRNANEYAVHQMFIDSCIEKTTTDSSAGPSGAFAEPAAPIVHKRALEADHESGDEASAQSEEVPAWALDPAYVEQKKIVSDMKFLTDGGQRRLLPALFYQLEEAEVNVRDH